jgi:hypothetical protein
MDQLKNNRDRYRRLEEIAGDPDITAEAKARRIRPVYEEAKAAESRLLAEVRDELKFRVRSAERKAFAPPNLFGADPALAQMNARDAFDRAARTNDQKELEATLERADLLGDNTLMRAVAWRASELRAEGVVRRYLDSDEGARKTYEAWAEAYGEQERVESYGTELGFGYAHIEEPPELSARSLAATQAGAA